MLRYVISKSGTCKKGVEGKIQKLAASFWKGIKGKAPASLPYKLIQLGIVFSASHYPFSANHYYITMEAARFSRSFALCIKTFAKAGSRGGIGPRGGLAVAEPLPLRYQLTNKKVRATSEGPWAAHLQVRTS
jgi:hypothetical protein